MNQRIGIVARRFEPPTVLNPRAARKPADCVTRNSSVCLTANLSRVHRRVTILFCSPIVPGGVNIEITHHVSRLEDSEMNNLLSSSFNNFLAGSFVFGRPLKVINQGRQSALFILASSGDSHLHMK